MLVEIAYQIRVRGKPLFTGKNVFFARPPVNDNYVVCIANKACHASTGKHGTVFVT